MYADVLFDKGIKRYKSWNIFNRKNNYEIAKLHFCKAAEIYKSLNNKQKATESYFLAYKCSNDTDEKIRILVEIANTIYIEDYKKGIEYMELTIPILLELNQMNIAAKHLEQIGDMYYYHSEIKEAGKKYELANGCYNQLNKKCLLKIVRIKIIEEKYIEAIHIYHVLLEHCNDNILYINYLNEYIMNIILLEICQNGIDNIQNDIHLYKNKYEIFKKSYEKRVIKHLIQILIDKKEETLRSMIMNAIHTKMISENTINILMKIKEKMKKEL